MTDPATVNVLKEISQSLKQQNRLLEALNANVLAVAKAHTRVGDLVVVQNPPADG